MDNKNFINIEQTKNIINDMGGEIIKTSPGYIHAIFTSWLFKFVDDFEIKINDREVIIRSASRTGYYDFGVNRRRVEQLRVTFENSAK